MSNDLDILERLRTDPAPPMDVDLAKVLREGRRRTRRRAAGVTVAACAAAVAAVAVGSTLLSSAGKDSTTPAGTSSTTVRSSDAVTDRGSPVSALSGRRTLTVGDVEYSMSVGAGLLTLEAVRDGERERQVAGLVGGSGAWRVVDGTDGQKVLAGVVPGRSDAIVLRPYAGQVVPRHAVALAPGRDFTAFVVTFAEPLDTPEPVADISWIAGGPAGSWILGDEPQMAALAVTMTGEGAAPLPPSDFTRTGPPATSGTGSVVISVDMPVARIGATATVTLQGDLAVKDTEGLTARLSGADPETAVARGVFQLTDGRTFAWGVAPRGATGVALHLDGGARAGTAVLAPMLDQWTAYAVQVEGSPSQVSGVEVDLGGARGTLEVIE